MTICEAATRLVTTTTGIPIAGEDVVTFAELVAHVAQTDVASFRVLRGCVWMSGSAATKSAITAASSRRRADRESETPNISGSEYTNPFFRP